MTNHKKDTAKQHDESVKTAAENQVNAEEQSADDLDQADEEADNGDREALVDELKKAARNGTSSEDDETESETPGGEMKKKLEEKERENKDLSNRLLRALADYDNIKKRAAKEVLDARLTGSEDLVKRLLPVIDTFESALRQFSGKNIDKVVLDGFEMLFMQFSDILEKEGLKPIKALGSKFDPHMHEALMCGSEADKDEDVVLKEFEKGYTFKERVIRSAKVQINQK